MNITFKVLNDACDIFSPFMNKCIATIQEELKKVFNMHKIASDFHREYKKWPMLRFYNMMIFDYMSRWLY